MYYDEEDMYEPNIILAMTGKEYIFLNQFGGYYICKRRRPVIRIVKTLSAIPYSIVFSLACVFMGSVFLSIDAYRKDEWPWEYL